MIVTPGRFLGMRSVQVWWPNRSTQVLPYLKEHTVVSVMQCSDSIASELKDCAFRRRPFFTSIIDLSLPEGQLWSQLSGKSCRYEINRARKQGPRVRVNERQEEALDLLNGFIDRTGYRRSISPAEWSFLLTTGDVFVVESNGKIVAAHVLLRDTPVRIRLLLSATIERDDPYKRSIVGAFNRYLHWQEILHYRQGGIHFYDFGGVDLNTTSPLYSITRFKLSFGGPVMRENMLHLADNFALRLTLRGASRMKSAWGRWAS